MIAALVMTVEVTGFTWFSGGTTSPGGRRDGRGGPWLGRMAQNSFYRDGRVTANYLTWSLWFRSKSDRTPLPNRQVPDAPLRPAPRMPGGLRWGKRTWATSNSRRPRRGGCDVPQFTWSMLVTVNNGRDYRLGRPGR